MTVAHQNKYRRSFGSLRSGDIFSYYNKVYVKTSSCVVARPLETFRKYGLAMNQQFGFSISEFPNGCGVWYLGQYKGFEI